MRLLLAAGGTGGHVIPGLVLARELCGRGPEHRVLFVGTSRGVENRLVPPAGFPLELLEVAALQGEPLAARLRNLLRLPGALGQASRIIARFRPDVVLGVGGYAAGPVMLAAALAGVPLAALEPNAVPGLANRWIAPYVERAFLGFPEAQSYFLAGKSSVTGVPVRREFFEVPPRQSRDPFTVLVFGGSQGARTLNRAAVEALPLLESERERLLLLHQTGQTEYNAVREAYERHAVPAEVFPFTDQMPEVFGRADLVVCRAGANTLAELAAAGKAAILVPFPFAANQHQLRNAQALQEAGAAQLVLNWEMDGARFASAVRDLLDHPEMLAHMEQRIRTLAKPQATARIVDELERMARRRGGSPS